MNSWKFNSIAQFHLRQSIADSLNIPFLEVYKTIKSIRHHDSLIETKDGKKYKIVLEEI